MMSDSQDWLAGWFTGGLAGCYGGQLGSFNVERLNCKISVEINPKETPQTEETTFYPHSCEKKKHSNDKLMQTKKKTSFFEPSHSSLIKGCLADKASWGFPGRLTRWFSRQNNSDNKPLLLLLIIRDRSGQSVFISSSTEGDKKYRSSF